MLTLDEAVAKYKWARAQHSTMASILLLNPEGGGDFERAKRDLDAAVRNVALASAIFADEEGGDIAEAKIDRLLGPEKAGE